MKKILTAATIAAFAVSGAAFADGYDMGNAISDGASKEQVEGGAEWDADKGDFVDEDGESKT